MKPVKLILIIFCFILPQIVFSQSLRMISGTLVDASKMPIPGVTIMIKGTTTGVVSDVNGKYSIKAPLGAILVYSYIGYINEEVFVTLKNSQPAIEESTVIQPSQKSSKIRSSFTPINSLAMPIYEDDDSIGTARFIINTPSFKINNPNESWNLRLDDNSKIASIDFNKEKVSVNIAKDRYLRIPHITFFSSTSIDHITRMPKRQDQFAQGRPINGSSQWQGPETNEFLSWGPAIKNLEYSGNPNSYDKHGNLVAKGMGNGQSANQYNPYDLFKSGFTFQNNLKISEKTSNKEYVLVYNNKHTLGALPNASKTGNYLEYKLNRKIKKLELKSKFVYDGYKSNLMSSSPGQSLLIGSIETTPPTFDNKNGFTRKEALSNQEAYMISTNLQRTYAPGISNNPYWLINNMIDHEKNTVLNGYMESRYYFLKNLYVFAAGTFESQKFVNSFGYKNTPNALTIAMNTNRTDKLQTSKVETGANYQLVAQKVKFDAMFLYDYTNSIRSLIRNDLNVNDKTENLFTNQTNIKIHNTALTFNLTYKEWLLAKLSQDFSYNSFYKNRNFLYAPSAGIGINFNEMKDLRYLLDPINYLKLRSTWGYTLSGNPQTYPYGTYNYQEFNSSRYADANFSYELLPNENLNPEKIRKFGMGLDLGIFYNKLSLNIDAYSNKILHGIFPRMQDNEPILENLADYTSRGIEIELNYHYQLAYRCPASIHLIFHRNRTNVTHLEKNLDQLPLGGFTDVYTALIQGQPKGVIVGTVYKRNEQGQLMIDDDGFPLVDEKVHVLGNPNPDFTLGAELTFNFGWCTFATLFEAGIGGKRWNGTENALSYLGVSYKTLEDRKVLEYLYPGVKPDGAPNTMPVDFANPAKSIEQNRWYRYGISGVAEDAMQDASYFRIKQITICFDRFKGKIQKEITLFIENPLLLTKYKGVDPESTLWGKSSTYGLDMFNFPSISRIGINFRISL